MPSPPLAPHACAPSRRRTARGFTLIELMVVVALTAILAAIALPSFGPLIDRYRVRRAAEDLKTAIFLARSEAIRLGGNVRLEKTTTSGCVATDDTDWSCGWVIYNDKDASGSLDDGELIRRSGPPAGVSVTSGLSTTLPSSSKGTPFDRWGSTPGLGTFNMSISPSGSGPASQTAMLCMASGGRMRLVEGSASCS